MTDARAYIIGASCRFPGAPSLDAFWRLLSEGRSGVGEIPDDRWSKEAYYHPDPAEYGKSYTFAAGVLDDIWAFDPAAFGLSPREAAQMDPQQRLALKLVWEALEDAGTPPEALSGERVGVYCGASSTDHGNRFMLDPAAGDGYTMTGNSLSLIANRVSYIFNFTGPSLTIDTACSSSLVALRHAHAALRDGSIQVAVALGVNALLNPLFFTGFSAARMLSPEGRCRAFGANPQGYVRAEGGGALVLAREDWPGFAQSRPRAELVASAVNSDGRTFGVSLPSQAAQARLLDEAYADAGVAPDDLAFVEAHGTGTRVGDAAEAAALGAALGARRSSPLPIGSVKSNIGHLEAASGVAGLIKAMLALERNSLPPSLHTETLNPDIPFSDLNLAVTQKPVSLARPGRRFAGVNSFGFGGTNAHVIIADAPDRAAESGAEHAPMLLLCAHAPASLAALGAAYAKRLDEGETFGALSRSAVHGRALLPERAAILADAPEALAALSQGAAHPALITGRAVDRRAPVAFVFSGNGSQWAGMGAVAYRENPAFKAAFDAVDDRFEPIARWSLRDALFADDLPARLSSTMTAQPLLFALQAAAVEALAASGLAPSAVLGHSVGEVAAAYAAGALDLNQAVHVIIRRSAQQEAARGLGAMAALAASEDAARQLLTDAGGQAVIAAINSPSSVTLSGPIADIDRVVARARANGVAGKKLDIDYPFHSAFMDPGREGLQTALAGLRPAAAATPFFSSVTGAHVHGGELNGAYWWRNIREPVRFQDAVTAAAAAGARVFVEVGPRPILSGYVAASLKGREETCAAVKSLDRSDAAGVDPILATVARAVVHGAAFDGEKAVGPRPARLANLPLYPWSEQTYRVKETEEAVLKLAATPRPHPFLGGRLVSGAPIWRTHLDARLFPFLGDHRAGGQPIFPAAGFAEMALAAAQQWLGSDRVEIRDMDIEQALPVSDLVEAETRVSPDAAAIEIASRRRNAPDWRRHAACRFRALHGPAPMLAAPLGGDWITPDAVYAAAERCGLVYGPGFRRLSRIRRLSPLVIEAELDPEAPPAADRFGLHPAELDAAFHTLFVHMLDGSRHGDRAFIPIHLGAVRLYGPGGRVAFVRATVHRLSEHGVHADFALFDREGAVTAVVERARFKSVEINPRRRLSSIAYEWASVRIARPGEPDEGAALADPLAVAPQTTPSPAWEEARLLADAAACRAGCDAMAELASGGVFRRDAAHPERRRHAETIACRVQAAGYAESVEEGWRLLACGLPPLPEILATLAADHPGWGADAVLAARGANLLPSALISPPSSEGFTPALIANWLAGDRRRRVSDLAAMWLRAVCETAAPAAPLRVLELGCGGGGLTRSLLRSLHSGARVVTFGADARALRMLERDFSHDPRLQVARAAEDIARLGPYDVIVSAGGLGEAWSGEAWEGSAVALSAQRALAPRGRLIAVEHAPTVFGDVFLPLGPRHTLPEASAEEWRSRLAAAGFAAVACEERGGAVLACAAAPPREASEAALEARRAAVIGAASGLRSALAQELETRGFAVAVHASADAVAAAAGSAVGAVEIIDLGAPLDAPEQETQWLAARLIAVQRALEAASRFEGGRVWIAASANDALAAALRAGARAARNENPGVDLRFADLSPLLEERERAALIAGWIAAPSAETELTLTHGAAFAARAVRWPGPSVALGPASKAQLLAAGVDGLEGLAWTQTNRRTPAPGEVEIAVEASGLNFRDVMWALGMLPPEALEDGFAGATLGFECAGRVTALGEGVGDLPRGALVAAAAPGALASHVTAPRSAVIALPDGVSAEAAATMPVAFLTAYYALAHLARLAPNEWTLIHGGAGGVGLAALQIALMRGARVIATAGTEEKRDFLRAMGAEHAIDSRSLAFADEVMRITGGGVDVALNSLSGEAMERTLEIVRPFGRFIELGKRDFYGNTKIGLRPFRRNVSYFGVDADALLAQHPALAARMLGEVMRHLAEGDLSPLPYRRFEAGEASAAFRLMQQSGHVGKILISPPKTGESVSAPLGAFRPDPERFHVVVGGLGGFGAATAEWLTARGASRIALIGRSGSPASAAVVEAIARMRAAGADIRPIACDAANREALKAALDALRRDAPIAGIVHAAMTLDDAALAGTDAERLAAVIRPKLDAGVHLDALTRDDALDYFVMYSSVSAFIGNPGQAAYAAANAYLEALCRRRRRDGAPALAVGWGPITDAGFLARHADAGDAIRRRAGSVGLSVDEALRHLGELLGVGASAPAAVTVAAMDWRAASALPACSAPAFSRLVAEAAETVAADTLDIAALIKGLDAEEARRVIARHVAEDVAAIFRMPAAEFNMDRPLADLGMDSLMLVELRMAAQRRFGVEAPLSAASGALTVSSIAASIHARMGGDASANGVASELAAEHASDAAPEAVAALTSLTDTGARLSL
ncbi:MAG: type I polyketide synthase [Hyphomicrobiales bacterium]|nr:type I polyketide synthase [Hyphomicrobiales bacterium]